MIFAMTTDPGALTFGIAMILACLWVLGPSNEK